MAKNNAHIVGNPVIEGARFEVGKIIAYAVRNNKNALTVRIIRRSRTVFMLTQWIPFIRGIVRLFHILRNFFQSLRESARMDPQDSIRGNASSRHLTGMFRTTPQSVASLGVGALTLFVVFAMMVGLPTVVELGLNCLHAIPRFAVNTVCCIARILGFLLSVYAISRLPLFNQLSLYRGAVNKVINAYETYGSRLSIDNVILSSRMADRSDSTFLMLTSILSIICFAFLRVDPVWIQPIVRLLVFLAVAAVVHEFLLPLENALPETFGARLRKHLSLFQQLHTMEPDVQIIEVVVCAFNTAIAENEEI